MRFITRLLQVALLASALSSCNNRSETTSVAVRSTTHKKASHSNMVPTIVIDPGHGGYDMGACARFCEEKDICLRTGLMLRKNLEQMGYHVIMTRTRDEFIPLKKRAEIANTNRSQVLVSLHFNSAKNESANGIEIFYSPKAEPWRLKRSKMLAQTVLAKMLSQTGANSRGVKTGNFCVIRDTHMPAILIEGGFITNEAELKQINDDRYLSKIASAIADALDIYFQA